MTNRKQEISERLERFLILPDANEWIYIRELRNEIAHDYPLLENDIVHILNELLTKTDVLYGIYDKMKTVYEVNKHSLQERYPTGSVQLSKQVTY